MSSRFPWNMDGQARAAAHAKEIGEKVKVGRSGPKRWYEVDEARAQEPVSKRAPEADHEKPARPKAKRKAKIGEESSS